MVTEIDGIIMFLLNLIENTFFSVGWQKCIFSNFR